MTALSPCVGVCRLDPETGLCEGCRRTISEIAEWPGYDEARRRKVLAALPERARLPERTEPGTDEPDRTEPRPSDRTSP